MFLHFPIEHWYTVWVDNYRQIFDAWDAGGVTGLIVGNMHFRQEDGTYVPAYEPDARIYDSFGVSPPGAVRREREKEGKLQEILDDAAARGWPIMLFDDKHMGGGRLPGHEDPFGEAGRLAQAQDLLNAFPQATGIIFGHASGERQYEPRRFGAELFDIRPRDSELFANLGFDLGRIKRGAARLNERFRNLTPDVVRYLAPGGAFGVISLLDLDEDALYWFRARQEVVVGTAASQRRVVDRLSRKVKLGVVPRTAALSVLTGQVFTLLSPYFDYLFPKHYFWHRGYDGLYGTVHRWVRQLIRWNPTLSEADALLLVESLFGIRLPGIRCLMDFELGFPEAFFSEFVYQETRRAIEATGDSSKVIFCVSSGRRPHQGDPVTARDLHGILRATKEAGAERIYFYPDREMGTAEWHVLSQICGEPWREDASEYWPDDTWREPR